MMTEEQLHNQVNTIRTALHNAAEEIREMEINVGWKQGSLLSRALDHIDLAQAFLTRFEEHNDDEG